MHKKKKESVRKERIKQKSLGWTEEANQLLSWRYGTKNVWHTV